MRPQGSKCLSWICCDVLCLNGPLVDIITVLQRGLYLDMGNCLQQKAVHLKNTWTIFWCAWNCSLENVADHDSSDNGSHKTKDTPPAAFGFDHLPPVISEVRWSLFIILYCRFQGQPRRIYHSSTQFFLFWRIKRVDIERRMNVHCGERIVDRWTANEAVHSEVQCFYEHSVEQTRETVVPPWPHAFGR